MVRKGLMLDVGVGARLKYNGSRFIERPLPRFSGDLPVCQLIINNIRIRCRFGALVPEVSVAGSRDLVPPGAR